MCMPDPRFQPQDYLFPKDHFKFDSDTLPGIDQKTKHDPGLTILIQELRYSMSQDMDTSLSRELPPKRKEVSIDYS